MKKILLAILFLALPLQAFAAIAFVGSLGTASNAGNVNLTSLTITGSNLAIVCWLQIDGADSNTVSTFNWDDGSGGSAQAFTQIGSYQTIDANANVGRVSLWGLLAPSTSNSRAVATFSDGGGHAIGCGYYSGVAQSSAFTTGSGSHTNGVTSYTQADTSDLDGSWHIGMTADNNGTLSVGANTTSRVAIGTTNQMLDDSNATVANTVSHTFNWNQSVAGAREAWVTAMMRPFVASAVTFQQQGYVLIQDYEN